MAHWQFGLVVVAAVAVRIVVVLGYPPILWFSDSYNYIYDAVTHIPDQVRANGYPFFLQLLLPLHSLNAIGLLQAAMGVAIGVAIYALLRHRGLPWWGATLPALPVLFDAYELHLEHMVTADPLFIFLVTVAMVILCWRDRPSVWTMALAGLLIGYATLVRSVGEPLLVVALVAMLARRVGWLRLAALAAAGVVPIAAYMFWFHQHDGKYALTESTGSFLYSRVSTFAECSKINMPADLRFLCDPNPPQDRPPAGEYIWADNDLPVNGKVTYTPLYQWSHYHPDTSLRFTATMNAETRQFAERAIEAEPAAYARAVTGDILHTFGWTRQPDPNDWYGNGPNFQFVSTHEMNLQIAIAWYATPYQIPGNPKDQPDSTSPTWCDATCQKGDDQARVIQMAERDFSGGGLGFTRAVPPWARLLQVYQRYVYLPGTLLGVIVLIGAAGVLARWRRWGGVGLLPWLVGVLLIVLPPITAGFSYRYVLAAVPVACLAAGLAFCTGPDEKSVRALAADLRRNLGRGGTEIVGDQALADTCQMDWSLFVCARKGHLTYAPDEPGLRDRLMAATAAGTAWRCLRCGAFVTGGQHGSGPAAAAPLVRRGKELRSELILRVFAVERFLRFLIIGAAAYGVWWFKYDQAAVQRAYNNALPAIRALYQDLGFDVSHSKLLVLVHHALAISPRWITILTIGLPVYAVIELVEGVGLWQGRRWGEYFAMVATSIFLPLEVLELSMGHITWLKVATFVINLALVIYLVWTRRLFGVRGGKKAYEARLRTESVIEAEQAALAAAPPGQPGHGQPASAAVQLPGDTPSSTPAPSGASSLRPTPPHSSDSA